MNDNENLSSIPAQVTSEQLHRLYDRLDDEVTPYALRVGKGENHLKAITIYCDAENVAYFQNIIDHEI